MSTAGLARVATLLSKRNLEVHQGVLLVIGFALLGSWVPTLGVVQPEFLVGGLIVGYALGGVVEALISTVIGGGAMALFWLIVPAAAGNLGTGIVLATVMFGNAVGGGLVGGFVGSTME